MWNIFYMENWNILNFSRFFIGKLQYHKNVNASDVLLILLSSSIYDMLYPPFPITTHHIFNQLKTVADIHFHMANINDEFIFHKCIWKWIICRGVSAAHTKIQTTPRYDYWFVFYIQFKLSNSYHIVWSLIWDRDWHLFIIILNFIVAEQEGIVKKKELITFIGKPSKFINEYIKER